VLADLAGRPAGRPAFLTSEGRADRMKKRLKEIADFRMGYQFRGKVQPDPVGTVRVIQIKDVDENLRISVDDITSVSIDRPEPYLVRRGDVLFLGRGHRLYAGIVPAVEPNTIATGYFFILRPNDRVVSPEYLAWSLNQPDFQESLRPFHRGTQMPIISKTDLQNLRIHLPPLNVQRRVVELHRLLDEERRLSAEISEKRSLLVRAVSRNLMHDPTTEKDD